MFISGGDGRDGERRGKLLATEPPRSTARARARRGAGMSAPMDRRLKILVGALTVAVALAMAVGAASARRLEFSEQRFLVLFRETTYESAFVRAVCDINLEGSFHSRTISKVSGQLIGYITEAVAHYPCATNRWIMLNGVDRLPGGETAPNTLPWHVRYLTFEGALPSITGIEVAIVNYSILVEGSGISCLYQSTAERPIRGILHVGTGGKITGLRWNEAFTILRHSGSMLCGPEIGFRGEATVGTKETWREVTVRLVL
jgi:hypothetical protein